MIWSGAFPGQSTPPSGLHFLISFRNLGMTSLSTSASKPERVNLYEVLGVSSIASAADLKAAHRSLSLKYHPDKNPGDEAARQKFEAVQEAYRTLSDPAARRAFDRGTGDTALPEMDVNHLGFGARVLLGVVGGLGVKIPTCVPRKVIDAANDGAARRIARKLSNTPISSKLSRGDAEFFTLDLETRTDVCIIVSAVGRQRFKLVAFNSDNEPAVTAEPRYVNGMAVAELLYSDAADRLVTVTEDALTVPSRVDGISIPSVLTQLDLYTPAFTHALEPGSYLFSVISENMFHSLEYTIKFSTCCEAASVSVTDIDRTISTKRTELEELKKQYVDVMRRLDIQERSLKELLGERKAAYTRYLGPGGIAP